MGASASFHKCDNSSSSCLIASIDGNIGSGKTTGKEKLREYIMSLKKSKTEADDSIIFVDEPTCEWEQIKDDNGVPILTNLYKDVKRFAFRFQMMAYITRLNKIRQALRTPKVKLIITERCLLTDAHVFAKMLYDDKKIEQDEYDIYTRWFDAYVDGNRSKISSSGDAENYYSWYQAPPSPPLSTYREFQKDQKNLIKLGNVSYLHFDE